MAAAAILVLWAAGAEAARPSEDETIARIERQLGQPLTEAPADDVARAVADTVQALTPQELQYSIDIVGAVADLVDVQTAAIVAEAARTAVADAAAAHPEVVEGWWAKLIDDSIAMVAAANTPATPAEAESDDDAGEPSVGAAAAAADMPEADDRSGALAELSLSLERPDLVDPDLVDPGLDEDGAETPSVIAGEPLPGTDLALVVDRLTDADATEASDGEAATGGIAMATDGPRVPPGPEPGAGAEAEPIEDDADQMLAMAPPLPPEPPRVAAAEDAGDEPAAETEPPTASAPEPRAVPAQTAAAATAPTPDDVPARPVQIIGPAPAVPIAVESKLGSFDGIVELVEFWLQKPVEQASTLELARAVQATVLMLPPDRLSAASAVAGAVAAVVPGPQAVEAVTRAAEAGVQVKASREPGRYTTAQIDDVLTSIGRATGNIGAIQPAAGPFGTAAPEPAAADGYADQVVDFGS